MSHADDNQAGEPEIPPGLEERLRGLGGARLLVPPDIDAAILAQARRQLQGAGRARRGRFLPRWLAAAAAVTFCAWLGYHGFQRRSAAPVAREDVNGDGRVDILDAFAVARRLQQGPVTGLEFDFNGDGVVDRRDVDAIAAAAVKLGKGEG